MDMEKRTIQHGGVCVGHHRRSGSMAVPTGTTSAWPALQKLVQILCKEIKLVDTFPEQVWPVAACVLTLPPLTPMADLPN